MLRNQNSQGKRNSFGDYRHPANRTVRGTPLRAVPKTKGEGQAEVKVKVALNSVALRGFALVL